MLNGLKMVSLLLKDYTCVIKGDMNYEKGKMRISVILYYN